MAKQDGQACGSECLIHCKQAEDPIEDNQADDHQILEPVGSDCFGQKLIVHHQGLNAAIDKDETSDIGCDQNIGERKLHDADKEDDPNNDQCKDNVVDPPDIPSCPFSYTRERLYSISAI